jgi:hypothetical protein
VKMAGALVDLQVTVRCSRKQVNSCCSFPMIGLLGKHSYSGTLVKLFACSLWWCSHGSCVCVCVYGCGHSQFDIRYADKLHACLSKVNEPWEQNESRLRKNRNDMDDACDLSHVRVGNGHVSSICTSPLFTRCGKCLQMTHVCQISRTWKRGLMRVQAINI